MPDDTFPLAELTWLDRLRFSATSGHRSIIVDADGEAGPSPMQAMAISVAGCMAMDVVAILRKGRHPIEGLRVTVDATRAIEHPRRFTHMAMEFHVTGNVPRDAVDRAIALSRERYCPALNSLRDDITFALRVAAQS